MKKNKGKWEPDDFLFAICERAVLDWKHKKRPGKNLRIFLKKHFIKILQLTHSKINGEAALSRLGVM